MKTFKELYDDGNRTKAVDMLNDISKYHEVTIEGYNVVRYEQCNTERTYIWVSYEATDE